MQYSPISGMQDLDSHEMIPTHFWAEKFGEVGKQLATITDAIMSGKFGEMYGEVNLKHDDVRDEGGEIDLEMAWTAKGCSAPGAVNMERRLEVMDLMGVDRQLIFPGFGQLFYGLPYLLAYAAVEPELRALLIDTVGIDPTAFDPRELCSAALTAHNDWVLDALRSDPDRLRPVAIMNTESIDTMMAEAHRMLAGGVRALWLPVGLPPGGRSPADEALAPFWSLAEEANAAVVMHIGSEFDFVRTQAWRAAKVFESGLFRSLEFPGNADIYSLSTNRLAVENYLSVMVLGGVFERHPRLRFGVIEFGSHWLGSLIENLDMWASKFPTLSSELSLTPSGYFARNVRVTPYHFEPVDRYLERHPVLADVLAYSTDYPHPEGGKYSANRFYDKVSSFGEETVEKFFKANGELLVPA